MSKKIAATGRKLNIISDARYRFERGIDPNSTEDGIELATEMVINACGGNVGSIISDSIENKQTRVIKVNSNFFEKILGCYISEKDVEEKLIKIGCSINLRNNVIEAKPPSWRQDLQIKEDLVEEVGRLIGFENIPPKEFKLSNQKKSKVTSFPQKKKAQIRKLLVSRKIMEIISWSFSNKNGKIY